MGDGAVTEGEEVLRAQELRSEIRKYSLIRMCVSGATTLITVSLFIALCLLKNPHIEATFATLFLWCALVFVTLYCGSTLEAKISVRLSELAQIGGMSNFTCILSYKRSSYKKDDDHLWEELMKSILQTSAPRFTIEHRSKLMSLAANMAAKKSRVLRLTLQAILHVENSNPASYSLQRFLTSIAERYPEVWEAIGGTEEQKTGLGA